ncbi:MAG: glycosyltransferase [Microbacterium gubbeenense]
MQIVVVTTWFPTARNPAAGSFIARDVLALSRDHDVRVVHLADRSLDDGSRDYLYEGIPVRRLPIDVRRPAGWLRARRMRAELLEGADLLHTMAAPALLPFVGVRPDVGWVHTEHWSGVTHLAGQGRSRLARPFSKRAFAGPDEVVAVSEYLANAVRALRPRGVSVIGNIVDATPLDHVLDRVSTEPLRILAVGTVKANKGWELAIDTVTLLRERGVDAELTWLGDGPDLDALRNRAAGLPVHTPGHVSKREVAAAMGAADVLMLPTTSETFSLVTVESMAAGLPVVATGRGAHAEFLTPSTGQIVPRTAEGLASGVLEMRGADRALVAEHGRRLTDRFSEVNFRTEYNSVYERVAKR